MSSSMNFRFSFLSRELNQFTTARSFLHWERPVDLLSSVKTLSSFCLDTLPNSALVGLINLVSTVLGKELLWSLTVHYAAIVAIRE